MRAGRARSRSRSSTRPAATTRPTRCSTSSRRNGQVVLPLRARAEPQRLAARHRRRLQRGRQRRRADAAPRARRRPADRARPTASQLFRSVVAPRPRWPHDRRHAPPRARAHRRRVRADRRAHGARAQRGRARGLLADVVRALRLQALQAAAAHAADRGRRACVHGPGRERRRGRRSAAGWRARSRSSRTTTRARSSRSRARPPASAASCATSSRSARGRSRSSTRCASARSSAPRARATCSSSAVAGIGHYGNSIGVATVGGEIYFEDAYEQNCLVNAMCLGLIDEDRPDPLGGRGRRQRRRCCSARAPAATASAARPCSPRAELGELDAAKRPTVQIGDPFEEKKLLECSLELLDRGLLVALQDLGAAGLTSSLGRDGLQGRGRDRPRRPHGAAARGRHGAVRDHDLGVPGADALRRRARRASTRSSPSARSGWSTRPRSARSRDTRRLRVFDGDALVGDMPVTALVDECPVYDLEPVAPSVSMYPAPPRGARRPLDAGDTLLALLRLRQPRLAPLGVRAVRLPRRLAHRAPPRAGRRRGARSCRAARAIAVSIDGNGRRVACDPYRGAVEAVLECSANLACVGAEPLGLTNCLNFGNPEKPHIAWQLTRAVAGLADACRALGDPGRRRQRLALQRGAAPARSSRRRSSGWSASCRRPRAPAASASRRRATSSPSSPPARGRRRPPAPSWRSCAARRRSASSRRPTSASCARCTPPSARRVRAGALRSAHDVAEGGLAVALAECCLAGGVGARVDLGAAAPGRRGAAVRRGPGRVRRVGRRAVAARVRRRGGADRHGRRRRPRDRRRARACASPSSPPPTPAAWPSCSTSERQRRLGGVGPHAVGTNASRCVIGSRRHSCRTRPDPLLPSRR